MTNPNSILPMKKITEFCKEHPSIAKLSLFGSALSGTLGQDSDIDLLVEFEPGKTPSLFILIDMEEELTTLLHRKTDLRTPEELSRYFRSEVLAYAKPLYVKTQVAPSNGSDSNSFPLGTRKNKWVILKNITHLFLRVPREKIISNMTRYKAQLGFKS